MPSQPSSAASSTASGQSNGPRKRNSGSPESPNCDGTSTGLSWISNEMGRGWVQLELREPIVIDRIVWGRDREQQYKDRLPTRYRIQVATEHGEWRTVASSDDRQTYGKPAKEKDSPRRAELVR